MSKMLDLNKSVHDLAEEFPEFAQVMVSLGFTDIAKPAALNTVGRVMTVPRGCSIKGISLDDAVKAFEAAGFTVEGEGASQDAPATEAAPKADATSNQQVDAPLGTKVEGLDEAGRAKLLESYIARLSSGESLEDVRADFVANFSDVDAGEIARGVGSPRSTNVVLVGALSTALPFAVDEWRDAISRRVPPKTVEANLAAFDAGRKAAER